MDWPNGLGVAMMAGDPRSVQPDGMKMNYKQTSEKVDGLLDIAKIQEQIKCFKDRGVQVPDHHHLTFN